MKRILILCALLAGCASSQLAMEYRQASPVQVFVNGKIYQVIPHPADRTRYWVQEGAATSMGKGFVTTATLGLVDTNGASVGFEEAVLQHAQRDGHRCTVSRAQEVRNYGYEIWLRCQ